VLHLSEDFYLSDAQYTVAVDGVQVGGVLTAQAWHASGQVDTLTVLGDWAAGQHTVTVTFLNDAWAGTPAPDRNLYLDGAALNGAAVPGASAALMSAGPANFTFEKPGAPQSPPPPGAGGTPVPAQPGYTVVLSDDFSQGYRHDYWGDPFPLPYPTGPSANGGYNWNPGDVAVRDGEMQITMTHQPDGTWTAGGFNSFRAGVGIQYGTVDFDARVEYAQGTTAAFLMWPMTDTWPPEIDILETPKNRAMHVLHFGSTSADASVQFGGPDPSEWHHYRLTWLPDLVKIETDGQVVASWDYASSSVPMGFGGMGFVGTGWDGWMGGAPDATTPPVVTAHLDNVVMAQWNGAPA
jgi:Glycosyl hydrolases family 16/Ca-dependent carbohydrate-binding module xylan-binding